MQRGRAGGKPEQDRVVAAVSEHAASMLRLARRYSLCADDAQDAYQRSLEIFLRRADSLEPEAIAGWLHTVVKHEAMAVRRSRARLIGAFEEDMDAREAGHLAGPQERVEGLEEFERAAEALARLKPQETRALLLKAEGLSYQEIAEREDWSYTKVNRCLTEGRRSFLRRYASIESGEECERWVPVLSLMADGEASARELLELRPHLRNCAGCRARLREFGEAPRRVAAVLPVGLIGLAPGAPHAPGLFARVYETLVHGAHERATLAAHKAQMAGEALAGGKLAAVAASATALAGGGLAVGDALHEPDARAEARASAVRRAHAPMPPTIRVGLPVRESAHRVADRTVRRKAPRRAAVRTVVDRAPTPSGSTAPPRAASTSQSPAPEFSRRSSTTPQPSPETPPPAPASAEPSGVQVESAGTPISSGGGGSTGGGDEFAP